MSIIDKINKEILPQASDFAKQTSASRPELEQPLLRQSLRNTLLWTHNTPIPTFHKILNSGRLIFSAKLGLQFRHGIDSQYGDVIFIMKPEWYDQNLKVLQLYNKDETNIYCGRSKKLWHPFYENDTNILFLSNKTGFAFALQREYEYYTYRQFNIKGNGSECIDKISKKKDMDWNLPSWCDLQLHLCQNVEVNNNNILKIMLPRWYKDHFPKIVQDKLKQLNITYIFYGPSNKNNFYNYIEDCEDNEYYNQFKIQTFESVNQSNCRNFSPLENSSTICLSDLSFADAERNYICLNEDEPLHLAIVYHNPATPTIFNVDFGLEYPIEVRSQLNYQTDKSIVEDPVKTVIKSVASSLNCRFTNNYDIPRTSEDPFKNCYFCYINNSNEYNCFKKEQKLDKKGKRINYTLPVPVDQKDYDRDLKPLSFIVGRKKNILVTRKEDLSFLKLL